MVNHIPPPSTLPPGSTVWAYLRDSGGPTQDRSVGQQKTEIDNYCQRHALVLTQLFVDEARSGGSTVGRDAFNEMIDMSQHEITRPKGILIWNYARFARDLDDSQYYKATLRKRGITIHSLTDPIPDGMYAHVVEVLIDIANEEKKRQTSRDAKRGLRELVEKHGCVPGVPPRGFKREPVEMGVRRDGAIRVAHRWVPDPDWIPRIQKAFAMRAAGSSLHEINKATRIFGSLNSFTTFWSNPIYRGILEFGDLTLENYCEPMIPQELWELVQNINKKYAGRAHVKSVDHPRRVHSGYLFSGLAKCARCSSPLYGHTAPQRNGSNLEAYRCTRQRRRRDCDLPWISAYSFEQSTLKEILSILEEPSYYIEIYRMAQRAQQERFGNLGQERKEIQNDLNSVRRQIDNLTAAIAEGGHSRAILDRLSALEIQEADLRLRANQLKKDEEKQLPNLSDEYLTEYARQLALKLHSKDVEVRRNVLRGLVSEIKANRNGKTLSIDVIIYISANNGPAEMFSSQKTFSENFPISDDPGYNRVYNSSTKTMSFIPPPVGAPLYRQTFSHPIMFPPKQKPRSK